MYRVGIDLIEVDDVRRSLQRFGDGYLRRIFSSAERRESAGDPARLAEIFAAKEATMKALGRRDEGVDWRSIQVSARRGAPASVALSGEAAAIARRCGMTGLSVSLAHDADRATAIVVMEGRS